MPEKQEIHLQKGAEEEVAPVQHPEKRLKFWQRFETIVRVENQKSR